jgi:hypothetical protein
VKVNVICFDIVDPPLCRLFLLPSIADVIIVSSVGDGGTVEEIVQTDTRFAHLDLGFPRTSRIEINAVIAAVEEERFWKFIMEKLEELYPTRNYNRAIELPSKDEEMDETDLYPDAIRSLILHTRKKVDKSVAETEKRIESDQEEVKGFLEVPEQKKKNKELVMKVIAEDKDIRELENDVAKLCRRQGINIDKDAKGNRSTRSKSKKKDGDDNGIDKSTRDDVINDISNSMSDFIDDMTKSDDD